jgi:hypothetical protein
VTPTPSALDYNLRGSQVIKLKNINDYGIYISTYRNKVNVNKTLFSGYNATEKFEFIKTSKN